MSVPGPGEDGGARGRSAEWKHSKVSLPTGPAPSQPQHWQPHFQDRENIFPIPEWKGHHWGDGAGCQGENLNFRGGCSATNFTNVCWFFIFIFFKPLGKNYLWSPEGWDEWPQGNLSKGRDYSRVSLGHFEVVQHCLSTRQCRVSLLFVLPCIKGLIRL